MIYKDENDDINYHNHIFMISGNFILNNDWILDSDVYCLITKDHNFFVKYTSLSKLITFSAASGDSLIAYRIGTIHIHMEYMDVDIKKVYYIPTMIANLLCIKELFAAGY